VDWFRRIQDIWAHHLFVRCLRQTAPSTIKGFERYCSLYFISHLHVGIRRLPSAAWRRLVNATAFPVRAPWRPAGRRSRTLGPSALLWWITTFSPSRLTSGGSLADHAVALSCRSCTPEGPTSLLTTSSSTHSRPITAYRKYRSGRLEQPTGKRNIRSFET